MKHGEYDESRVAEALQACLEMLEAGSTVQECLDRYPDQAQELEQLLGLALAARSASSAIEARPGFQDALLVRLTQDGMQRRSRWTPRLAFVQRPLAAATVAALALVFGGWGVSSATAGSIPGETLYPVKQAQERFLLLVVPGGQGKARLHARLAQQRASEMERMASAGAEGAAMDRTAERMARHAQQVVVLLGGEIPAEGKRELIALDWVPGPPPSVPPPHLKGPPRESFRARIEMRQILLREMLHQREMYARFMQHLPSDQRERADRAFRRSQYGLVHAIRALDAVGGPPP